MNPANPLRPGFAKHKKSSSGGIIMTIVLVLALAAGGVAYHRVSVQRKAAAAELAARKEAEAKAARARKAAELEAARKEAEEKARLEAERLAAEGAAGKRQKKEPEMVEPSPEEPKEEPVAQEDPRLEIFKKPVLLVSLKANNAANRKVNGARLDTSLDYLSLAALFEEMQKPDCARVMLEAATQAAPGSPLGWERLIALMSRPESGTKLEEWDELVTMIKRKFRSRPDYLAMAARVEDEYIFPMRDASANKRHVARDLKKLEKETDEGRSDLTSAAIKRQADILMENGDRVGVAALYRKSMKDYARRAEVFEALMGQYYGYVSQDQEAVLQLAREAESFYNRSIRTKSGDYFKVKKEVAIQRKIAGYYEKGGNKRKADSLRKDAEKREKNSKKGIREEN